MSIIDRYRPFLSMILLCGLGTLALTGILSGASAKEEVRDYRNDFLGRWTLEQGERPLTDRAKPYKTVDIVACGKELCGIHVKTSGKCGEHLFRIAQNDERNTPYFEGVSKWGDKEDRISIFKTTNPAEDPKNRPLLMNIGERGSPMSRVGSMPMFRASYKSVTKASCRALPKPNTKSR